MDGGIFLLLGSNMGDRLANLEEAKTQLGGVVRSSSVYVTAAWGNTAQPEFYNQVVEVHSKFSPGELLKRNQQIEIAMGRKRDVKWGPRIIDIDILFYNDDIINTQTLTIPHPEIRNRRFTLVPLLELTNKVHPVLGKTISELLGECNDPLPVTRLQR
ncbi:MAG TPA: 2-amino-4-hydroxy-6-hydroxymethyldihydropteridine diphosphokinase [Cyclobacteriaceae bacterium]